LYVFLLLCNRGCDLLEQVGSLVRERRTRVAIGLGSNLGDRASRIREAVLALRASLDGIRVSPIFETDPVHLEDQPAFLNACCTGTTRLTPRQLLSVLQDLERSLGRTRDAVRFGPRVIDLDLLLFGDRIVEDEDLVVPHPRMRERGFVMRPLAAIAPEWIVPGSHGHPSETVAEIAERLGPEGVRLLHAVSEYSFRQEPSKCD
jgi:2-amino-4-hydroxy-6-hydroxymethyldihydropteridine diphosphokinase